MPLYRCGLSFREEDCVNIRPTDSLVPTEATARAAERIRDGVTAFCCAADHQAHPLIQELAGLGLKVPPDCSITGFDSIATPPGMVSVSTVRVRYDELGRSPH